jgi:KaiC/GvpD/RAD55 family RecA-like ATPase
MVPDIHETRLTILLYSLAEGVVEMSLEEMGGALRCFVRIRFLRGVVQSTEWSEFPIGPQGIEIISD